MNGIYTAATGMQAQQTMVDVISHNIANINTTGFKRQQAEFQDLLYVDKLRVGHYVSNDSNISPNGVQVGLGVKLVSIHPINTQGSVLETGKDLDLAINGSGYFIVDMPDGSRRYTRNGAFSYGPEGELVNSAGNPVAPGITVPDNATQVLINRNGRIEAYIAGQNEPLQLGQLELARFVNDAGLRPLGDGLFEETISTGPPVIGIPGEDSLGFLSQKYLEASNVDPVISMTDLIRAQRAYEMSAKAMQIAADIWKSLNNFQNA